MLERIRAFEIRGSGVLVTRANKGYSLFRELVPEIGTGG